MRNQHLSGITLLLGRVACNFIEDQYPNVVQMALLVAKMRLALKALVTGENFSGEWEAENVAWCILQLRKQPNALLWDFLLLTFLFTLRDPVLCGFHECLNELFNDKSEAISCIWKQSQCMIFNVRPNWLEQPYLNKSQSGIHRT